MKPMNLRGFIAGYAREEKLMQDAWNKERQALAEDSEGPTWQW